MTAQPMPADAFWRIIDRAAEAAADPEEQLEALRGQLSALPLDGVVAFEAAFRRYLNEAYRWDLWGAAYVIHGGCSDDGFEYFRRWLVARGRHVYEAALADPESLARLDAELGPDGIWEFEEIYYVAGEVFSERGGKGHLQALGALEAGPPNDEPAGEPFEDDGAYLAKRYPQLWRRFGETPLG